MQPDSGDFIRALIKAVPYKIHTVLTDNGTHFTTPGNICSAAADIRVAIDAGEIFRTHSFKYACAQNHIDHRLTKPRHPWTTDEIKQLFLFEAAIFRLPMDDHVAQSRV